MTKSFRFAKEGKGKKARKNERVKAAQGRKEERKNTCIDLAVSESMFIVSATSPYLFKMKYLIVKSITTLSIKFS